MEAEVLRISNRRSREGGDPATLDHAEAKSLSLPANAVEKHFRLRGNDELIFLRGCG